MCNHVIAMVDVRIMCWMGKSGAYQAEHVMLEVH